MINKIYAEISGDYLNRTIAAINIELSQRPALNTPEQEQLKQLQRDVQAADNAIRSLTRTAERLNTYLMNRGEPEAELNRLYWFVHGKEFTLDGVHGVIKVVPGYFGAIEVEHHPSAEGRESNEYLQKKAEYHDHYMTQFTDFQDVLDIAVSLGFKEQS